MNEHSNVAFAGGITPIDRGGTKAYLLLMSIYF